MSLALQQAKKSLEADEVPVGVVIVERHKGEVVVEGQNRMLRDSNPAAHAEIIALNKLALINKDKPKDSWIEYDFYCTLEPCTMCLHAIALNRIKRVIFAARNNQEYPDRQKYKSFYLLDLIGGIQASASERLLQDFFHRLR